ncbi:sortase domain-containing protein [Schleiferilactobacillus perolens]|jgi:hypothetical protein|uniref:sortase domain-containing protein n=1 Tax=Schleiferilactobacillus perolens TaxID=100468 RepID=UPI002353C6B2|nr:sortase [Schleiferilactobacillus perolens]MCI2172463.1 sortase [Schleiferilactobacillus perolens]
MKKRSFIKGSIVTILAGLTLLSPLALNAVSGVNPNGVPIVEAAVQNVATLKHSTVLCTGFGSQARNSGRTLPNHSAWQVTKVGIGNDGARWLQVGNNQWLPASATSESGASSVSVVYDTISYDRPVVKLYQAANLHNGIGLNTNSSRQLAALSSWTVTKAAQKDGLWWFQVGTNQWVADANGVFVSAPLRALVNQSGTSAGGSTGQQRPSNLVVTQPLVLLQGYGPNASVSRTLPVKSAWRICGQVTYKGETYYDLGGGLYVNSKNSDGYFYLDTPGISTIPTEQVDQSKVHDGDNQPSVPTIDPQPSVDPGAGKTPGGQTSPVTGGSIQHGVAKANTMIINGYQVNYLDKQLSVPDDVAIDQYYQMTPKEWFALQNAAVADLTVFGNTATPVLSVSDNKNSYLEGHNFGAFTPLLSTHVGDVITITDSADNTRNYRISDIYTIRNGSSEWKDVNTGEDLHFLLDAGNKERVALQTCIDPNSGDYSYVYVADGI